MFMAIMTDNDNNITKHRWTSDSDFTASEQQTIIMSYLHQTAATSITCVELTDKM